FYSVWEPLRVNFDRTLKLEFHGVKVTRDAGLLTFRDRFHILMEIGLSGVAKRSIWEMSDDEMSDGVPVP
ncbi:MAG: hypothetical protein ACYSWU_07805, partial [Planctomycetota bacterium]